MSFFKSKAKLPVPEKGGSPYLNGREEWLERYGSYKAYDATRSFLTE